MERDAEGNGEAPEEEERADLCGCKRRRKESVDVTKWYVTDFAWPNDGERGITMERNKAS